jgi:hypothetical protein
MLDPVSLMTLFRPDSDPALDDFCDNRDDGNYPHPYSCTHYIGCAGHQGPFFMICAENLDGCPLYYVPDSGPDLATSHCDYPDRANCVTGSCPEKYPTIGNKVDDVVVDNVKEKGELPTNECEPDTPCTENGKL